MHTNELELLLAYIAQQRDGILNATYGLTDEQAASQPTISGLSLITLVQHAAEVEQVWIALADRRGRGRTTSSVTSRRSALGERTLADVVAHYRAVAAATEMSIREVGDLDRMVPVPKGVPWFPDDVEALERALDPAPPDGGGGAPRRPRRLPARGDRRGDDAPADGHRRGLARVAVDHEVAAGDHVIAPPARRGHRDRCVSSVTVASRVVIRSGQLTVNSFCMPMKACGVPSGPAMKHSAP